MADDRRDSNQALLDDAYAHLNEANGHLLSAATKATTAAGKKYDAWVIYHAYGGY